MINQAQRRAGRQRKSERRPIGTYRCPTTREVLPRRGFFDQAMYRPKHIRPRSINTMLGGAGVAGNALDIARVVSEFIEVQLPRLVKTVPGVKPLLVKLEIGRAHV